jgi:hypothetical protein
MANVPEHIIDIVEELSEHVDQIKRSQLNTEVSLRAAFYFAHVVEDRIVPAFRQRGHRSINCWTNLYEMLLGECWDIVHDGVLKDVQCPRDLSWINLTHRQHLLRKKHHSVLYEIYQGLGFSNREWNYVWMLVPRYSLPLTWLPRDPDVFERDSYYAENLVAEGPEKDVLAKAMTLYGTFRWN